jgi:2'-5' RNA ligase
MTTTHHTAVVLIPPLDVWEPIQDVRRRFDRQFRRWMPHITLLYPFRPVEMFDAAAKTLTEACQGMAPFELTLTPAHVFEHSPRSFTMWLAPQPPEPIVELQRRLLACVPDCDDVNNHASGFVPHLSVGQAREREELDRRLAVVRAEIRPLTFTIADVAMIRRGPAPSDAFEVDRWLPLGNKD